MPFLLLAYRSGMSAAANKHFARKKISLKKHNNRGLVGKVSYSPLGMADTHTVLTPPFLPPTQLLQVG